MKEVKEVRALAAKELGRYRDAFTKSIHQMEKQVRDFFDSFQGPCKREHPLGIHKLDAVPAQPELTF